MIKFKKKTPKTPDEKMGDKLLKEDSNKANVFLAWATAIILLILFVWFFFTDTVHAQTITRNYSGSLKVRIDGASNQLKPCYFFFPGGGFVTQNWAVCNTWSAMAVDSGFVSCRVGYSTSFFPSTSAATKGISDCMNAVKYIKQHAAEFNIDTNQIYLMGTSAGGFCAMGAYMYKVNVAGVVNGWGGVLSKSYLTNSTIPVFNISTDYDKTVPVECGNAFGVSCCGSGAIYGELLRLGVITDWLVFEGYNHGLRPKDSGYNARVEKCFNDAVNFFK